jgi:hypothetical protein
MLLEKVLAVGVDKPRNLASFLMPGVGAQPGWIGGPDGREAVRNAESVVREWNDSRPEFRR